MTWEQLTVGILTIIYVNFILSGDNAVVIAMAIRSLPPKQRRLGLFWGSFGAVALRIVLTVAAALLLEIPGLRLGGGLLLVWIAWKLVRPSEEQGEEHVRASANLWEAIKIIIIADLIMSLDNVLAIAAAAKGSMELLIFGLALSIPIILCCSALIANLMNKYPWLVLLGGGILGKVAGEMLITDPFVSQRLGDAAHPVELVVAWGLAVGIVLAAIWKKRSMEQGAAKATASVEPAVK
jgi:YjbE family integral membrane protein